MGIVDRIQELCSQNGIKIRPLEEQLGIANGSIKRWDISSPSCERMLKVAEYFNVSVDWLLTGEHQNLSESEIEILKLYNSLSHSDQEEIRDFIKLKLNRYARQEKDAVKF